MESYRQLPPPLERGASKRCVRWHPAEAALREAALESPGVWFAYPVGVKLTAKQLRVKKNRDVMRRSLCARTRQSYGPFAKSDAGRFRVSTWREGHMLFVMYVPSV